MVYEIEGDWVAIRWSSDDPNINSSMGIFLEVIDENTLHMYMGWETHWIRGDAIAAADKKPDDIASGSLIGAWVNGYGDYIYFFEDADEIWFQEDGTVETNDFGGGDWEDLGGGVLRIRSFRNDSIWEFNYFISGDTLKITDEDGDSKTFERSEGLAHDPNAPWPIDPYAELDTEVQIRSTHSHFDYPSEIFYLYNRDNDNFELRTHDPNGGFLYFTVFDYIAPDQWTTANLDWIGGEVNDYGQDMFREFFAHLDNALIVEEYPFINVPGINVLFEYTSVVEAEEDGVPVKGIIYSAVRRHEVGGQPIRGFAAMVMIVHSDVFDDYRVLFDRIID